ncbi:hypothetical protein HDU98_003879 [Podochytrium sp. JEL0797]|nr:hypothetical protein HDU98_003879 [Podochytrium sp. JEL0797]
MAKASQHSNSPFFESAMDDSSLRPPPQLSPDVVREILLCLPFATIFRLRRVSKSFDVLISSRSLAVSKLRLEGPAVFKSNTITLEISCWDTLFFHAPPAFQDVYARTFLGGMRSIKWGDCPENSYRGTPLKSRLPSALGLLNMHLQHLDLSGCELIGMIPHEIGNLRELTLLDLGNNKLEGEIPVSIAGLGKLEQLILSFNALSGQVPRALGSLGKLKRLNLSFNRQLGGRLPKEWCGLADLEYLSVAETGVTGGIPAEFGQLAKLKELFLGGNRGLGGQVPPELGNLFLLESMHLSACGLSGLIPREFGRLVNLRNLDLSFNALQGVVPTELGQLNLLERCDLRRNVGLKFGCGFRRGVLET